MGACKRKHYRTFVNIAIAIQIIGILILFFCPVLILRQASSPSSEAREVLVSPFLTVYSISTVFLLLIPLLVCFAFDLVSFFFDNRVLDFVELLLSIYVLVISVCFLCTLRFSLPGMVLTSVFTIVLFLMSAIRIYLNKKGKKKIE